MNENVVNPYLEIFNRWGDKIAVITDLSAGWDGLVNGRKAASGTYFYTISFQSIAIDKTYDYFWNGFVQLL